MARVRNVEIKARCSRTDVVRKRLEEAGARYVGLDQQTDTYLRCPSGRLKLREGSIETNLIAYQRADEAGPKLSAVSLYRTHDAATLRTVLTSALPIDVVVEKSRHIYFLDNVKVHVDSVPLLGHFVEIEAIDDDDSRTNGELDAQCRRVMEMMGISPDQLVDRSYSDLLRDRLSSPIWAY